MNLKTEGMNSKGSAAASDKLSQNWPRMEAWALRGACLRGQDVKGGVRTSLGLDSGPEDEGPSASSFLPTELGSGRVLPGEGSVASGRSRLVPACLPVCLGWFSILLNLHGGAPCVAGRAGQTFEKATSPGRSFHPWSCLLKQSQSLLVLISLGINRRERGKASGTMSDVRRLA